ncbi:unnamed protein product, partial [Hymenolepis diminuta]
TLTFSSLCLYDSNLYLSCLDEFIDSPSFCNYLVSFKVHLHSHMLVSYLLLRCSPISSNPHLSLTLSNPHLGSFNTLWPTQLIVFYF